MYSGGEDHTLSLIHVLLILARGDGQNFYLVLSEGFAHGLFLDILLLNRVSHNHVKLILQLSIRIGVAVGKIHIIIFVLKLVAESQGIQESSSLRVILLNSVWIVGDLHSASVPSHVLLCSVLLTVDQNLHSVIVE